MHREIDPPSRRHFLLTLSSGVGLPLLGCAPASPKWRWHPRESGLIAAASPRFDVVVHDRGPHRRVLRQRARPVPAELDLDAVARRMEQTMRSKKGVGIAGPQVGLRLRVATLLLDYRTDRPHLLFVRNPVIVERSSETIEGYEGCLSVPGVGGLVRRNRWIKIEHQLRGGEIVHAEADGPNAVLWQHELDHLDGVLYLDRLLAELLPMDEVRRRREQKRKGAAIRRHPRWASYAADPILL